MKRNGSIYLKQSKTVSSTKNIWFHIICIQINSDLYSDSQFTFGLCKKKHTHTQKKQNSMYTLNANCAFARILFALTRNRCYSQNARAKQKVRFHLIFNAPKHLAEYSKITHRPALCAATHWIRNCCHSFHSLETVLADNGCDC